MDTGGDYDAKVSQRSDLPAKQEKKKENSWFLGENAYKKWQKDYQEKKSKGKEETSRLNIIAGRLLW